MGRRGSRQRAAPLLRPFCLQSRARVRLQVTKERVTERRGLSSDARWAKESEKVKSAVLEAKDWGLRQGDVVVPVRNGQGASGSFLEVSGEWGACDALLWGGGVAWRGFVGGGARNSTPLR